MRDHLLLLGFDLQTELRARAAQLRSSEQVTVSSSMLPNASALSDAPFGRSAGCRQSSPGAFDKAVWGWPLAVAADAGG